MDREGTTKAFSPLDKVTDLVFAAYVEKPTMAETVEPNARMLKNTLDALAARAVPLQRIVLAGGAKSYGFSLGAFNAPNLTKMRALQELASRRLARRGRTEFDREPDILGRIVGGAKEPPCSLGQQLHSLTAARTCAIDDQSANEVGRLQSDFLHDHAADREAKYVNLFQAQRLDEGDGVSAHPLERRRDLAGASGDARFVEQDHLTVASEAIRHSRVPIIHGADVVLVEDDGHTAGLAESAIGEADSVSLNELCRRGLVSMNHMVALFII